MSLTAHAAFVVSESGSVVHEVYTTPHGTHVPINSYGSPYLGNYEDSDSWRSALADYAMQSIGEQFDLVRPHGWSLAYVDDACTVYVFAIDFDQSA